MNGKNRFLAIANKILLLKLDQEPVGKRTFQKKRKV